MMRHLCVCDFDLFYVQTRLYLDNHPLLVNVQVFCLKVFFARNKIFFHSGNLFLVSDSCDPVHQVGFSPRSWSSAGKRQSTVPQWCYEYE